ncbi:hypothetical protein WME99_36555 [Sorangium sp. So ce136]|uniref:hypothetical protein n=1 Tax=Sorangium sp. So ce136 TaxID=3133284 RepID=UPI003F0A2A94
MRTTALLMLSLALAGCGEDDEISASDVFTLDVRGVDPASEAPTADGRSVIAVEVCAPPSAYRRTDLKASVWISAGRWEAVKDGALENIFPLGRDACAVWRFVAGNTAGPVRVEATLEGFTQTEQIELEPAEIERIDLSASPLALTAGKASQVQLQAVARVPGLGKPSAGTTIGFEIEEVAPADAVAVLGHSFVRVNDDGIATTSVTASPDVTSIVIRATATPPEGGSAPPEPAHAQIELRSILP